MRCCIRILHAIIKEISKFLGNPFHLLFLRKTH